MQLCVCDSVCVTVCVYVCVRAHICQGTLMSENGPQNGDTWVPLLQGDPLNTHAKFDQQMVLRRGVFN